MKRTFYGWWIAIAAMLTLFITNGLIISGLRVFDASLLETFGWSRGELTFRDFLTFTIAGLLGPLAGALADRFGVRKLMAVGALLLVGCLFFYSRVASANQMYLIHVLFAVVLASCGLIVSIMLVSRWFVAKRGLAIGLTVVGTSLGGMFFPLFGTWAIERWGWRQAFAVEIGFPIVLLALIALVMREFPADVGQSALGTTGAAQQGADRVHLSGLTYKEALATPTFWALAFVAMTTFYSIMAAVAHLFLFSLGAGFSPQAAGSVLSTAFGFALIGKFGFGWLADHLNQKRVLIGNLAVMGAGALLLSTLKVEILWIAVALFGLGWGGLYTLLQLLTVESFGLRATGKILGTITVVDALGGGLGAWLTGVLFDSTGSYRIPFTVLAVLVFLALGAATQIRRHAQLASEPVAESAAAG